MDAVSIDALPTVEVARDYEAGSGPTRILNTRDRAHLLLMHALDTPARPCSVRADDLDFASHWHYHDMHQLMYAFEGAFEVEIEHGWHLVPHQLAAWIPAGVPHRIKHHRVRSASVFLRTDMVQDIPERIRTLIVTPLMREMIRETLRWPMNGPDSATRQSFFVAMGNLCGEWIKAETNLFMPNGEDPRLQRALGYTLEHMDAKLPDVCRHAGMSERSLRRHLKAETGWTWEACRQRSRLLRAIALLSETNVPIANIAGQCGFESPSAFAKSFRLTMRDTPREYRNRARTR